MSRAAWPEQWDSQIAALPSAHILQTREWGQIKERVGWTPFPHMWRDDQGRVIAAASILQRTLPLGGFAARIRILYSPRGPLLDWSDEDLRTRVLAGLEALARQQSAIFIKIDPDVYLGTGLPDDPELRPDPIGPQVAAELQARGWLPSCEQIQFRNTVLVDLNPSEEQLLANMKQKTRYNIRLAQRKGVAVRPGGLQDLELLYRLYAETSVRDGFVIRDKSYYMEVWSAFMNAGMAEPLIAEVEGQPVAGVIVYRFASRAWYLYGMSRDAHREKMPNYLLQWEAMRRSKAAGCEVYDLWGAPDRLIESDPLWGVYRFKEGLGGTAVRTLGAWDWPAKPLLYKLYTRVLPRVLDILRRRGKERTRLGLERAA